MCIRMHPKDLAVICVCGKVMSYTNSYSKHMRDCQYLNRVMGIRENIERKANVGIPFEEVRSNFEKPDERVLKTGVDLYKNVDNTYFCHSIHGEKGMAALVHLPIQEKFKNSKIGEIVTELDSNIYAAGGQR